MRSSCTVSGIGEISSLEPYRDRRQPSSAFADIDKFLDFDVEQRCSRGLILMSSVCFVDEVKGKSRLLK